MNECERRGRGKRHDFRRAREGDLVEGATSEQETRVTNEAE